MNVFFFLFLLFRFFFGFCVKDSVYELLRDKANALNNWWPENHNDNDNDDDDNDYD